MLSRVEIIFLKMNQNLDLSPTKLTMFRFYTRISTVFFFLMMEDINNFTLFRLPRQQGKYWSSVQILDLLKKNYFVVVTL